MTTLPTDYHTNSRQDLQPYILDLKPDRVLDVGCAAGYLGEALKEAGVGWVEGIENDWDVYPKAKERLDEVYVADAGNKYFMPDRSGSPEFDVVVFGDILEHLPDPWGVVKSARRWLREGGHIIVSMPNAGFIDCVLQHFSQTWRLTDAGIMDKTHLRWFCREDLRSLIEYSGGYTIEILEALHVSERKGDNIPEGMVGDVGFGVRGDVIMTGHGVTRDMLDQLYTYQWVCVAKK